VLPSNPGGYGFSVRIVSLLPSTTEILFAIGAGGNVVGVTFECDYPPEACSRRIVSTSALPSELSAAEIDTAVFGGTGAG
jgi:iron complex transport system substrate-binding protein